MHTISSYHITEQLYDSANSLVYRGHRQTDAHPVILKVLKEAYPSPERIAWFKREYELTCSVNLTGVIQIYGLETDEHHWVMVLEDFGGDSLRRLGLAGALDIASFLHLAIGMAEILGHVHQRQIMHKDINPSNIVFNPTTRQIKFIDFGIATVLSRENPTFRNPRGLEGTLPYMSPEQAGRMNRAIDYRTDFYSLGVTFYELLTGQLPFISDDVLELVHSHIARQAVAPHEVKPDIPPALSTIILKLMAKNAEDRYQSAYGLKADLEECLRQWQESSTIKPFRPGQHDVSDRFQIPQKLYGREREIETLLAAFERVSQGTSEMLLVSGYAGIGKSALVQEIYKPITRQRGYFIAGKFEQFQRNIPYSAFIQAFRSLVRHLLTESESEIARWRQRILDAVGKNGQVLIEVIPEVELIIGSQPAVVALGPTEAQNRLNMVLQNVIKLFTKREHPLVLFLDDLQWADGASFKLMELLMTASDSHYLFLIGAYRENEVPPAHPLWLMLNTMQRAAVPVFRLSLTPLDVPGVTRLVRDTLRCNTEQARPLAELLVAKTGGNPFFLNEFLKSLYIEGLIGFDHTSGTWQWDLRHIETRDMTDNVVELMANRVQQLAPATQMVLKLAACIGNQFDLETLAVVNEQSQRATAIELWEAVVEGLVLPLSDAYKVVEIDVAGLTDTVRTEYRFTHDRIQQAVYSLIPKDERQAVHWRVGHLLLRSIPPEEHEERIFDIVYQLNRGRGLATDTAECMKLARLNLLAGRRAIESAAYEAALSYIETGVELLPTTCWHTHYDLTLALYQEYAQVQYLNGHFEQAEALFDLVLEQAQTSLEKAQTYNIKMILYTSLGHLPEVIDAGLKGLALLDMQIPAVPAQAALDHEIAEVRALMGNRTIIDLLNLPNATAPDHLARMRLLGDILIAAWWTTNKPLYFLVSLKMVHHSLLSGNTETSAFGYVWYGVVLGSGLGDYRAGYEFGELALRLNERFHNVQLMAKVNLVFGAFVQFWRFHLKKGLKFLKRGYQVGVEVGDLLWAGINGYAAIYTMLVEGDELDEVYQESQRYLEFARKTQQIIPVNMLTVSQQFILSMKGLTRAPGSFTDNNYNEEHHIKEIKESEAIRPVFWYYKIKLQALYLFGHYSEALKIALDLDRLIEEGAAFGNVTMPEHYFYYSLTLAALHPTAPPADQGHIWQVLTRNQNRLQSWAYSCPENFRHKYLLISAEMRRLEGAEQEARTLYEQAITSAHENHYQQNEALAHELAACFYLTLEIDMLARYHLLAARTGYMKWGATAKVKALDKRYPHLLNDAADMVSSRQMTTSSLLNTSGNTSDLNLDLATVIKASQAISREIVLDALLAKLMRIVIENAGAERGLLMLEYQGQWVIEAEGNVEQDEIRVLQELSIYEGHDSTLLPLSIINYVVNTREHVVLNDAACSGHFTHDPYIIVHQPRSVLCVPLLYQGTLMGMLYLENNLTTDAFTPERLTVLNLLAAQAAISIKNAMLYTNLEESEAKYRTLFQDSKDAIFITTPDGRFVDMNPAGQQLFGYTHQELLRLNAMQLYKDPDDRRRYRARLQQEGSLRDYEVKLCKKDGTEIDCLMTTTVRYDQDGQPVHFEGIIRDITAQKRAAAERVALLDQQARKAGELQAIIQSMADGLLVVDTNERIMIVNPVAAELLGQPASVLIDQPLERLTDVDDAVMASGLQHIVEQVRKEMLDPYHALPEERIALGERIVRLQSAPTLVSDTPTGAVVVIQDITRAVEADRAKSAFIANASHEMRTPLASMKGFVDVFYLTGIENLQPNQQMFLDTIRRQTDNLVQLVNDLLEMARLEQGTLRAERRWVALESAVDDVIASLHDLLTKRAMHLHTSLAPHLPPIWIDAIHLRRILVNILSNAVKYSDNGSTIAIRAYELHDPALLPSTPVEKTWKLAEQRSVVVEIEDNGVGISEADQPRIFERFFRSDNHLSIEAGGTGLGLAITRSLIALHGGQIGFWSVEHQGTCFWVRLPAPSTEPVPERGTVF
jgi:PAS domain S-box-containing protein